MSKTLSTLLIASALSSGLIALSPEQAQAFNIDLSRTFPFFETSSSYVYSQNGITLTAIGFSKSSIGNTPRDVARSSLGIGVYTPGGLFGIDQGQIDGTGDDETLRLTFNQAVVLNAITFARVGRNLPVTPINENDDFKLIVDGNQVIATDIPGGNLLDTDSSVFNFTSAPTGRVFDFTVIDNYDDYYVKFINITPVPEPLTLLGSGIALSFGTYLKRKMDKQKTKA